MTQQQQVVFDKQEQLDQIQAGLMPAETVIAVYDCIGIGTGLVALTDKRVIVQDKSFGTKKTAVTSIPYAKMDSVSYLSDKNMFRSTSSIAIHAGVKTYEADFRGEEKAKHAHNVILWYLGVR